MFSVELSTREWDGHVVALGGELDLRGGGSATAAAPQDALAAYHRAVRDAILRSGAR